MGGCVAELVEWVRVPVSRQVGERVYGFATSGFRSRRYI